MIRLKTFSDSINESMIPRDKIMLMQQIYDTIYITSNSEDHEFGDISDMEDDGAEYYFTFNCKENHYKISYYYHDGEIDVVENGEQVIEDIEDPSIPIAYFK